METNFLEQMKIFAEYNKAMGGGGSSGNAVMITSMILSALGTVFAAVAGWVGSQAAVAARAADAKTDEIKKTAILTTQNVAAIHTEVNSKTAAMVAKLDDQHAIILRLSQELATLRERDQGLVTAAAVAAATDAAKPAVGETTV